MIKRILEISSEPYYVSVRLDQLLLRNGTTDAQPSASVPCEDVGVMIVDHPGVSYSHQALTRLTDAGAAVVLCGGNHQPTALLLPLPTHSEVANRVHDQVASSVPVRKRLWKQIVRHKIRNQAANLQSDSVAQRRLMAMIRTVKSGDPENVEAQAARIYWEAWRIDPEFHRNPDGTDPINGMLNYGYAVLRAAVARAIVAAGLVPALGLHHRHRANPFCLADDLMEPMRPWVDLIVSERVRIGRLDLDRDGKAALIGLLHQTVQIGTKTGPLMVALHRTCASLVRCFRREDGKILFPRNTLNPKPCI